MAVDVPRGDGRALRQPGSPYKFSETPARFRHAGKPPSLDETRAVLGALGYSDAEIDHLAAAGALK
jgi:crotonobetainyl-CoA:carnitine CoA-transferase CaiB-like acyl-CoA transferase